MKCKYCGKKGVKLSHYAKKHQKQLQAARRRNAGKGKHRSKGGSKKRGVTHPTSGYRYLTLHD